MCRLHEQEDDIGQLLLGYLPNDVAFALLMLDPDDVNCVVSSDVVICGHDSSPASPVWSTTQPARPMAVVPGSELRVDAEYGVKGTAALVRDHRITHEQVRSQHTRASDGKGLYGGRRVCQQRHDRDGSGVTQAGNLSLFHCVPST